MIDYTQLSDTELQEAVSFHRRQRNMSRGINEAAHARQAQIVRLMEAEEARRLVESEAAYKKADRDEKRKAGTGEYFVTNSNNKKTHSEPFKTSDQAISHANAQEDKTGRVHTVHHIKNGKIQKQWQYSDSAGRFASYNDHAGQTTNIHEEVEQIDELSSEKKMAYGKAAFADYHKQSKAKLGKILSGDKDTSGESRKIANRLKGISTSSKTEEVELDEISRDLARSYIRKVADKNNTGEASPKEVMKRSPGLSLAGKKAYGIGGKAKVNATEEVDLDEANILPSNFSDRTTPLPNKKAYAIDKANSEKKPVSLKKPPFKIDEVSQAKAAAELALRAYGRGSRDRFGFGEYGDDHEVVISPKTHQGKIIKSTGMHTAKKPYKEEVDLDEGVSNLSDARLKFHVLNDIPHGSYSKKEMSAEHLRRKKTGGPAYNAVKPSLNEAYTLYHPSYTDAINTALNHHKDLTVSSDDRDTHIASGPRKPSEGKTVSHNIPATDKSGNAHMIHIQVYNKGGSKPFELNTYSSKTPKKRMKEEASMTPTDMKQREDIVKGMKKSAQDFKDRYGSKWKSVMYATATKAAMKEESEQIDETTKKSNK